METLMRAGPAVLAAMLICGGAQAGDYDWDDIFAPYRQRIDTMTTSSGNAQDVNTATHMLTPWPPHVHDRRIPGSGPRAVDTVERYQRRRALAGPTPQPALQLQLAPAAPARGEQGNAASTAGGSSSGLTSPSAQ